MQIIEKKLTELKEYEKNPRRNDQAVAAVAASIQEFGFKVPIIVDRDGVIVAGHTRLKAAKKLGMDTVPCIIADDLSPEQIRAFRLADNKTAELAEWDPELLLQELGQITIDMEQFGFDAEAFEVSKAEEEARQNGWFDDHESGELTDEDSEEYAEFLQKFEPKRTTDDCYTPAAIYDAIADWVARAFDVNREKFLRPFYPGGDYQKEKYKPGDVVVDNPPFSILAEIVRFYEERGIGFFLFAPTMTLFSSLHSSVTALPMYAPITYENGAVVNTSFLTNLGDNTLRVWSAPELYQIIKEVNDRLQAERTKELPKYSYPDNVITSAMVAKWGKYGIDYRLYKSESVQISALDAQKEAGKAIYGKGYLLSERAAAERAAAERAAAERAAATRWKLSDRELKIVEQLGKKAERIDGQV